MVGRVQTLTSQESVQGDVREAVAWPRCRLEIEGDRLTATVTSGIDASDNYRKPLGTLSRHDLLELIALHRIGLCGDHRGGMSSRRVSPTERLLYAVYDRVSSYLIELLSGLPRVALELEPGPLRMLPIETACRPGAASLLEVTQCFRVPDSPLLVAGEPRCFVLEVIRDECEGLNAAMLEMRLVSAVQEFARVQKPQAERVLHVVGHEPGIPTGILEPYERAHVVLSGCDSLPNSLPAGVASAIGSLWPVDDALSVTLMTGYHLRLALGIGPLEALRQAQFLHRCLPPEAWASFVYVGLPD